MAQYQHELQQWHEQEGTGAVTSRRQLFAGAAAAAAALAVGGLPRPALAADPANVIDGQGETFLVPTSAVENFTAAQRQVGVGRCSTGRQGHACSGNHVS